MTMKEMMIKMISVEKLLIEEVQEFENRIENGDAGCIRRYFEDTAQFYQDDITEIQRRRMVIGRADLPHSDTYYGFALLSALLKDRRGWEMAVKRLENKIDPGFLYLVYCYQVQNFVELDRKDAAWAFLLSDATEKGHIPSAVLYWRSRLLSLGFLGRIMFYMIKLFYALKAGFIALRNPMDRRIAHMK